MKKILFVLAISAFIFTACTNNEETYAKLVGEWHCSDWTVAGDSTNRCTDNVYFILNKDKTYTSVLGAAKESGTYKLQGERVIFSPENKTLTIPVQILRLNEVYFEFMMNRGGTEEIMTLKKKEKK